MSQSGGVHVNVNVDDMKREEEGDDQQQQLLAPFHSGLANMESGLTNVCYL